MLRGAGALKRPPPPRRPRRPGRRGRAGVVGGLVGVLARVDPEDRRLLALRLRRSRHLHPELEAVHARHAEALDLEVVEPRRLVHVVGQLGDLAGGEVGHVGVGHDVRLLPRGEDALDVVAIDGVDGLGHLALPLEDASLLAGLDVDGVDVGLGE